MRWIRRGGGLGCGCEGVPMAPQKVHPVCVVSIGSAFGPSLAPFPADTDTSEMTSREPAEFALAAHQAKAKSITCINNSSDPGQHPACLQ